MVHRSSHSSCDMLAVVLSTGRKGHHMAPAGLYPVSQSLPRMLTAVVKVVRLLRVVKAVRRGKVVRVVMVAKAKKVPTLTFSPPYTGFPKWVA